MEMRFQHILYLFGLIEVVKECHHAFKCWFSVVFNLHANVELNFGNSTQIGHRFQNNLGSNPTIYFNRLIKPEGINAIID